VSELKELLELIGDGDLRELVQRIALSHPATVADELERLFSRPPAAQQRPCYRYEGGITVHAPGCSCYQWQGVHHDQAV
jgi:hypothetical protein